MTFQEYMQGLGEYLKGSPELGYQLIGSLAVIFILWLARLLAIRLVNRKVQDVSIRYKWRKNLTYVVAFLGILIVGRIWFEALGSVTTFLGLLSAGLAVALKDPITDLAGWLFIIWRRPFHVGDRIQLGEVKGDVIDIRVFKFTVLEIGNWVHADQSTGRVVHLPNHQIFTKSLANYTSDFQFIWNEIQVLITFESNWRKAKDILQEIADSHLEEFVEEARQQVKRATKSYLIHYRYLTPIVYTDVKESGVNLTIRYLTDPRQRRIIAQAIWEDLLDAFKDSGEIELAYPTMRLYKSDGPDNQSGDRP